MFKPKLKHLNYLLKKKKKDLLILKSVVQITLPSQTKLLCFSFMHLKVESNTLLTHLHVLFLVADIYDKVSEELEKSGHLDCECVGGGRIRHDSQAKKIHVYGYSMVR